MKRIWSIFFLLRRKSLFLNGIYLNNAYDNVYRQQAQFASLSFLAYTCTFEGEIILPKGGAQNVGLFVCFYHHKMKWWFQKTRLQLTNSPMYCLDFKSRSKFFNAYLWGILNFWSETAIEFFSYFSCSLPLINLIIIWVPSTFII